MSETDKQDQPDESNDAFEAGFSQTRSTEPAKPEPAQEAPAEPAPEPEPEKKPDEWEGVSPAVKAKLEGLEGKLSFMDKMPDRIRNIEGHIGGLTSQLKTALASAKAVEKTGGEAPSAAQIASAQESGDKWKQIKEDYPEWAEAMEERLAAFKPAIPQPQVDLDGLQRQLDERVQKGVASFSDEARSLHVAIVGLKHEGWESTVATDDFKAWFAKQKPEMQALASSPRSTDAIRMLDAFKADKGKQTKEARLKSAIAPQGVTSTARHIDEDAAFEAGFARSRGA